MIGYLTRRVVQAVIVVLGVSAITFILYHLFPGGVNSEARIILGPRATPAQLGLFINQNGLNKPLWEQFGILVGHVFTFNLGYSYKLNEPVRTIILQKLPKTVLLLGLATLVTVLRRDPARHLSGPAAEQAVGLRADDAFVHLLRNADVLSRHRPHPVVRHPLAHLPAEAPQGSTVGSIRRTGKALVLPVFTLAAVYVAGFSRYMRSSMMEALTEDYVRTARAKGLSTRR